jgi:hypothetical protein
VAAPTLAVGLLTCEREAYTAHTLKSFAKWNDLSRFDVRLHVDDASETDLNRELAVGHGFFTVKQPARMGCFESRRLLVTLAVAHGAEWLLILENDWETVRPFPWDLFQICVERFPRVYCLRMYGERKERHGRETGDIHKGRDRAPVEWTPLKESPGVAEIGNVHWGCPPAVTELTTLDWLLTKANSDRDIMHRSGKLKKLTVRPIRNVVFHIGQRKTPGFKY